MEDKLKTYPNQIERNFKKITQYNASEANVFRVMQWNMLARALCIRDVSSTTPVEAYDWEKIRKWRIIAELIKHESDIICLEEADFYEDIKPYLHSLE